jgi:DNA repair ATPase RecN
MNKIQILIILLFISFILFILFHSYQLWKQNMSSCSCRKEGMTNINQELENVLSNITIIINTLSNMSNELNKLRDWLVVHNDTLDKKTVEFGMVNISGNLDNMSLELSKISDIASTYSGMMSNSFYRQTISKIANDLGNQSIIVKNASNDLMIWSEWLEQNNRLNEIPGKITHLETILSQLSIYLTSLANHLSTFSQNSL